MEKLEAIKWKNKIDELRRIAIPCFKSSSTKTTFNKCKTFKSYYSIVCDVFTHRVINDEQEAINYFNEAKNWLIESFKDDKKRLKELNNIKL